MAKNKVELILTGDAKGATRAFGQVDSAAHGLSGKLSTLSSHLGKIAIGFAGLYAIKEVASFLVDAGKAAAEDADQQAKLAKVVQNVTGATDKQIVSMEAWITKTQMATGISDSNLRPALQNLVVATGSVSAAQGLMGVAMDISVAKAIPLETVTKAMQKAHDGNTGALGRLGIATKDAEGKTLSFEQIMKNAEATFGGSAAAAADTLAGKTKRIGEMFGEAKESLGAVFLPVLENFMGWVTANMPAIQAVFETAFAAIGRAIDWVTTNIIPLLITAFNGIKQWIIDHEAEIKAGWQRVSDAFKTLRAFVVDTVVPGLKAAWDELVVWWQTWGPTVIHLINEVKKAFVDLVEYVRGHYKEILESIQGNDPTEKLNAQKDSLGGVLDKATALVDFIKREWPTIGPIIQTTIDVALVPVNEFFRAMDNLGKAVAFVIEQLRILAGIPPNNYTGTHLQTGGPGGTFDYSHSVPYAPNPILRFASGGIVTRPTLGLVGEAGPEAIIPLTGGNRQSLGVTFSGPVTIVANDPRELWKALDRELALVGRAKGLR